MALYKSFTLKSREALAISVGLASPHAEYIATGLAVAVDHPDVLFEVTIQGGPMRCNRVPMMRISLRPISATVVGY